MQKMVSDYGSVLLFAKKVKRIKKEASQMMPLESINMRIRLPRQTV